MTDEEILHAEALRRFDEARALVEDAQHTLERASSVLASLTWGAPACERVAKTSERAHALWRWLSYVFREKKGAKLTLDGNNAGPFLRSVAVNREILAEGLEPKIEGRRMTGEDRHALAIAKGTHQ